MKNLKPPNFCLAKKSLVALMLGSAAIVHAANFFVVAPIKPAAPITNLEVTLGAGTLAAGEVGRTYNQDLSVYLSVTGDSTYTPADVSWSVGSGGLPAGLTLDNSGRLSGTPTLKNTVGDAFQVVATYKTKTGQQGYTIVVNGATLNVAGIYANPQHACAITPEGGVKCWGRNTSGQLGDGTKVNSKTPVAVVGLSSGVVALTSGGQSHTCALTVIGGVKCWGENGSGQLGNNSTVQSLAPVDVSGLSSGVASIGAGTAHTCALTSAGGMNCWGYNGFGQLGDGTKIDRLAPVTVSGLSSGVTSFGTKYRNVCAVVSGGVKCWGSNYAGQLGNTTTPVGSSENAMSTVPLDVAGLAGVVSMAVGDGHNCAVTTGGGAKCWGDNSMGQLGGGFISGMSQTPVDVLSLSGVTSLANGNMYSCAVTSGAVKCWGWVRFGNQGNNSTNTYELLPNNVVGLAASATSVSLGASYSCAALSNGKAQCWGTNTFGQLGDNTTLLRANPTDILP